MVIRSPAKINLYLEVLGERSDGYHDIETVFQKIGIYDTITLEKTGGEISVRSDSPEIPEGEGNLACIAARLLKEKSGSACGVKIRIEKAIPVGAGLGGGSSNAASVLLGLNGLWELDWERKRLIELGETIGADVPFFLSDCCTAVGRGKGERLTCCSSSGTELWVVLAKPPFQLSSAEIYGRLKSDLTGLRHDVKLVLSPFIESNLAQLDGIIFNRLEEALADRRGEIERIKRELREAGARCVLMSGSGPAVFGIAGNRKEAVKIAKNLAGGDCRIWTARILTDSFSE